MAWTQFWDGMWYNDSTGETSNVDPATEWFQGIGGLWYNRGTGASSPTNPTTASGGVADPYADTTVYGAGGSTVRLLNEAAQAQGIDPSTIDWNKYAVPVARAMSRTTGTQNGGWELGASDAYIANLILREAALGTVSGQTDPRFAAKASAFAPDPTGENGYYDKAGNIYQAYEQAGIQRDADLDAKNASEAEFQFSDIIPMIIGGGFASVGGLGALTEGLSSALSTGGEAASLAAVESTGLGGMSGAGLSAAEATTAAESIFSGIELGNGAIASGLTDVVTPYIDPAMGLTQEAIPTVTNAAVESTGLGGLNATGLTPPDIAQLTYDMGLTPAASTVSGSTAADLSGIGQAGWEALPGVSPYVAPAAIPSLPPGTGTIAEQVMTSPSTPAPVTPPPVTPPTLGQVASTVGAAGTVANALGSGTDADLAQFGTGVSADGGSVLNTGAGVSVPGATAEAFNWNDWLKVLQSDPAKAFQQLGTSGIGGALKDVIGSGFAYQNSKDYQDQLLGVMNRAIDVSDPFASQRPFYQNELKSMYTNPNYWNNSPILSSMKDNAVRETNAKMASQGYNMSGNQIEGLGETLQRTQAQYALPLMQQTGGYAGGGFGPGTAGTAAATTGAQAAQAGQQGNFALGNLFNAAWNGATGQPAESKYKQLGNTNLYMLS